MGAVHNWTQLMREACGVTPRGLYRTISLSGAQYVFLDLGRPTDFGEIPKEQYDKLGHQPPYDELPTKEQYQEMHSQRRKSSSA
jgi:hypothetical protein